MGEDAMNRLMTSLPALRLVVVMILFAACGSNPEVPDDFLGSRKKMVEEQILARGLTDEAVLQAMGSVPRHEFVPDSLRKSAYEDHPLPIDHDQTISQPYVVAYMTEALRVKKGDKILEIGTGSGYQAAVLAHLGAEVYSIEIVEPLGIRAREVLKKLNYQVHSKIGDGYEGWPQAAPFDGIIVTAAPKAVPTPLIDQLKEGGRLVIPVGSFFQDLKIFKKVGNRMVVERTLPVSFVPMTGKADS
jgi:protein-L-isoaspartate(D-aspartate) O-methyltransferase